MPDVDRVFQQMKIFLREHMGVHPAVSLVIFGSGVHLLLNTLLRKPITSPWGLLGPSVLGIVLESFEIWIQYKDIGLFAPGNDPVLTILGRHCLDVGTLLAGPLIIVALGTIWGR